MAQSTSEAQARLDRLMGYLAVDPQNLRLIDETAQAAVDAGAFGQALTILERRAAIAPHGPAQLNIEGLAAMARGDFESAVATFEGLIAENSADPALRFNLAWSRAMTGRIDEALSLLDPRTTAALARAAMLEVQLLHGAERHEEALAAAKTHIANHPIHRGLLAAASVIAIDMEDMALARACAEGGAGHPDAEATLGVLALAEDDPVSAATHFESALARSPNSPRALMGRGLVSLLKGEHAAGAEDLERGAAVFGDHIGSWVAAGWARLIAGDPQAARAHFEHALEIDPTFAETQGSLAVIAALEGNVTEAQRLTQTALRLDRKSFAGTLAHALIVQSRGDAANAHAIIERALHTPISPDGKTIAQSLARFGLFA